MKAILFYAPNDIRYEDQDEPRLAPGELLVKVESALTGGTDVKTYLNGHPKIIKSLPSSFGYEFAGTIAELGQDVQGDWKLGDRVVSANTAPCFKCFFCKKKEFSLCENLDFLNGSFAEYIKIPSPIVQHNLYKIPDQLNFKQAAMTQTLAVVLHAFRRSNIKSGDTVTVFGLGPIGLSFIKLCKAFAKMSSGKITVIAIGRSEHKRQLAKANGADHVLDASQIETEEAWQNLVLEHKKISSSYGSDVVIEAVGKATAWTQASQLVRPGGLVNFFGGCPRGSKVELDTYRLHYEEIKTIGVFHHTPVYIREALNLIASGNINMDDLISHEMPLAELEQALQLMIQGKAMKISIQTSST